LVELVGVAHKIFRMTHDEIHNSAQRGLI
jgi:hypothetical protein